MAYAWIFAKWEGLLLLGGFWGVVVWKLANGSISLDRLFEGDIRDRDPKSGERHSTYVSAGRVQSFVVVVSLALYYLSQVVQNPTELPKLPMGLVEALAASQLLYLGGKAQAMFLGRLRNLLH
jgi:hypothetical protein